MKLIIDIDEKLASEGFERNFTEEERNILIRAIGNGIPYEETISAYEIAGQKELNRQNNLNNIKFVEVIKK